MSLALDIWVLRLTGRTNSAVRVQQEEAESATEASPPAQGRPGRLFGGGEGKAESEDGRGIATLA